MQKMIQFNSDGTIDEVEYAPHDVTYGPSTNERIKLENWDKIGAALAPTAETVEAKHAAALSALDLSDGTEKMDLPTLKEWKIKLIMQEADAVWEKLYPKASERVESADPKFADERALESFDVAIKKAVVAVEIARDEKEVMAVKFVPPA